MFERETHREKILESRLRELRLKVKTRAGHMTQAELDIDDQMDQETSVIRAAEIEFYKVIEDQLKPPQPVGENIFYSQTKHHIIFFNRNLIHNEMFVIFLIPSLFNSPRKYCFSLVFQ